MRLPIAVAVRVISSPAGTRFQVHIIYDDGSKEGILPLFDGREEAIRAAQFRAESLGTALELPP